MKINIIDAKFNCVILFELILTHFNCDLIIKTNQSTIISKLIKQF